MRLLITSYVMLIKYLLIAIIHTYIHKNISKNGNGNGIYIPHFLYVYIQMRFTCVRVRSDISIYRRRRLGEVATHPMNHEIAQRPDQHTGNSTPYSLR